MAKSASKTAAKKPEAKKPAAKAAATKAPKEKTARKVNPALMKPLTPSSALAAVVGSAPLARPEVISKIWTYIKANKLQDQKDKRAINADSKLRPIFGKDKVSMFEMTKLVNAHLS
jgi:upstream activation factor subunit UAF30